MSGPPVKQETNNESIFYPFQNHQSDGVNAMVKTEAPPSESTDNEAGGSLQMGTSILAGLPKFEESTIPLAKFDSEGPPALNGDGPRIESLKSASPAPSVGPHSIKSESSTPPPVSTNNRKKTLKAPVQLIGELPMVRQSALAIFNEIVENNYQYKSLGRSREALESMTCDCGYQTGNRSISDPCGAKSDCINRLTQVECLPDDCRWGSRCQNQRFQKREYANIEIVQTEKKGYGLRAENDIPKDAFIYEYVGDVVSPSSFKKRMRDYANEGIEHFYFMMLQKDEFIDATKSGGIGRFANHSCNPNCYVAKWTIGDYVRMGIFAKRHIQQFEEITFNYNVDRYGHQAQTCYCGEPNCIGFIGGKTQTDVAVMDDLLLDALGITDEAEIMELKGTKKKKGKKFDDPDFLPSVKPISEKDAPTLIAAIRQTPSRKVLMKVLTRIRITEDQAALRQIMRLRGYSLMSNLLADNGSDADVLSLILETINSWPLMNRNKVDDSRIGIPVKGIVDNDSLPMPLRELAQKLLDHWETLPIYKRIAKRLLQDGDQVVEQDIQAVNNEGYRSPKRVKDDIYVATEFRLAPILQGDLLLPKPQPEIVEAAKPRQPQAPTFEAIRIVIAQAAQAKAAEAEEAARIAAEESAAAAAKAAAKEERKKARERKKSISPQEKEALKEKQLHKLISPIVVKCLSKYSKSLDSATFKKHAKDLTQIIAEKEKKSASYKENRLDKLSDDKVVKMTKFAKEYVTKIIHKIKKSGRHKLGKPSSSALLTPSTSASAQTPDSAHGADVEMDDDAIVDAEAAMEEESDAEGSDEDSHSAGNGQLRTPTSPMHLVSPLQDPTPLTPASCISPDHVNVQLPADPRRRPPMGPLGS